MSKVTSIGFLTDIPRLLKLADAVSKGVVTDDKLSLGEVRGIANKLAGFKQSNVDFRVVPSSSKFIGRVSYVIENEKEAKALYTALLNDQPLPPYGKTSESLPQPKDVSVTVLNGTTTSGLADTVAARLRRLGYVVKATGNAEERDAKTTKILFTPGAEAKALLVQDEFRGSTVEAASTLQKTDIVIILGSDARASPAPG
jgi:hypothetical protein